MEDPNRCNQAVPPQHCTNQWGIPKWAWIDGFLPNAIQTPGLQSFQLDIVGFLAILGEGSVETISQVATLSWLVFLPRLIPAPQIFIRPSRPEKLETTSNARVVGIHSGNSSEDIHHVAHALHRGDKLSPNTVLCVRVTENDAPRPSPKRMGPLAWLAILGFLMSGSLLALAIYSGDPFALIAIGALSLLSTNTGLANKWRPTPNNPQPDPHSPPGDVVIKYPQGAFIVVKCAETTSRYLYFNPSERCLYLIESTTMYRFLSLISTLLLMTGVVALANATIVLQSSFAISYILINIFYWIGAALPPAHHWDLSRLKVEKIEVHGGSPPRNAVIDNVNPTYTEALWKAIAVTETKDWVREASWAPKTPVWDEWLLEAEEAAKTEPMKVKFVGGEKEAGKTEVWTIRNWDSRNALSTLLRSRTTTNIQNRV